METLTIVVNEPSHNATVARTYRYTINHKDWTIGGTLYKAGTLLLKPIVAEPLTAEVTVTNTAGDVIATKIVNYFKKTYTLKVNPDGWFHRPLDCGFRELVPPPSGSDPTTAPKVQPIVDRTNQPVKEPWPLNGEGKALRWPLNADVPTAVSAADWKGVFLKFWPYCEADWGNLLFTKPGAFTNPRTV